MKLAKGIFGILLLNAVAAVAILMGGFLLAGSTSSHEQGMIYSIFGILGAAGIGVLQALYVIPIAIHLRRKAESDMLKGVLIGVGITLLGPLIVCGGLGVFNNFFGFSM